MSEKPQRVFIDPPGVEPEGMEELLIATSYSPSETQMNIGKRWRLMFTGMLYIFTAFALWICILMEIPVEVIPYIFLSTGIFFVLISVLIYKKHGERRFS